MTETARTAGTTRNVDPAAFLPDDLIDRFRARAADYDRENRFFDEDLAELRELGYLQLLVPVELGGLGGSLLEAGRIQRRLAEAAPATALAMNMHLVVTGAALHAHRLGAESGERILREAADGKLFAFGISEAGNEAMLFDAATRATPDGDGYTVTGTKIFTSLAPAWDRLVVHGRITDPTGHDAVRDAEAEAGSRLAADAATDPDAAPETDNDPQLVFGLIERTDAVRISTDWDTHGMRATQSCTTHLQGAPISADHILTITPVGPNPDPFVTGIFGCFELLISSVYIGIAQRALAVGTQIALTRRSATRGIVHADDPHIRWRLADAAIGIDGVVLELEKLLADLDALGPGETGPGAVDHGARWFLQFSGAKSRATETAIAAVDEILRASGGAHFFRRSELERLSRDVRAGMYHPSDDESVHASYATALLGEIGAERDPS